MKRALPVFVMIIIGLLTAHFMACKKPYDPPVIKGPNGYLVVAGVINTGSDPTIINLSRTVNISSNVTNNAELHATVTVESDQNASYPLVETGNGNYASPGLNLDDARQYRLRIITSNKQVFLSDLEPVIITPPIDSLAYNVVAATDTGLQIYVNTHDATNNVKYYRWDYSENWRFHAKYDNIYIQEGFSFVERTQAQMIFYCYTGDVSDDILLGSSAKLSQNVIYQQPIIFIPYSSEKIEDRYTILLHQYALSADAYNFWVNLKKNTEQLGSIFDAVPSEVPGNIHCISDPTQPVVGYLSVGTMATKRIYISATKLPAWQVAYPYQCPLDTMGKPGESPVQPRGGGYPPPGYYYTTQECFDCTIRGSLTPPPFWTNF